jgi:hypothetical protein
MLLNGHDKLFLGIDLSNAPRLEAMTTRIGAPQRVFSICVDNLNFKKKSRGLHPLGRF